MNEVEQMDQMEESSSSEPEETISPQPPARRRYPTRHEDVFCYKDNSSVSSIHTLVLLGDLQGIKRLIKKGKSPNVNDNFGNTPLHLAVDQNQVDILKYLILLPDININAKTHIGETPLFLSLNKGFELIAMKLIEAGADYTIPNLQNETPLHVAVTNSLYEIAKILLEKGVDINAADMDGYTPLHEAVQCENFEMLSMLLYYGADTSLRTLQGITPFMLALNNSVRIDIQEELFKYEVNFNMESIDDCSLLFFAINTDSPLIMDIINSGANVNYNVGGRSALDMILYSDNPKLFYDVLPLIDLSNLLKEKYSIFSSVINCSFPKDDWLNVVFSLITCDKASELIEQFFQQGFYHSVYYFSTFVRLFSKKGISEEEFIKFVDISLCLSVDVYFKDIQTIYEVYGFNKALSRILLMEIKDLNKLPEFAIPILFCDMRTSIMNKINNLSLCFHVSSIANKILDFCTPDKKFRDYFHIVNEFSSDHDEKCRCMQRLKERSVPSLIELSRNKSRESICDKYNINTLQSHKFYYVLRRLQLPQIIQDIITCKRPLYF